MVENLDNEMSLVRIEDLRHCLVAAFERLELPLEDAEQVADVLLDSELRGHESHGVHLLGFLDGDHSHVVGRCGRCVGALSVLVSAREWQSLACATRNSSSPGSTPGWQPKPV